MCRLPGCCSASDDAADDAADDALARNRTGFIPPRLTALPPAETAPPAEATPWTAAGALARAGGVRPVALAAALPEGIAVRLSRPRD